MDTIEKTGYSTIQHGPLNNRIYLLKYDDRDENVLPGSMLALAQENGYTKIIAKVPESAQPIFLKQGYIQEAYIPEFYNGNEGTFFMAQYLDANRQEIQDGPVIGLSKLLRSKTSDQDELPAQFTFEETKPHQAAEMAEVYRQVFKTYPFPIFDPSYLESTMRTGKVIYFAIRDRGKLVGLSSAELDRANKNAEMTDFAVLPEYRGQKLAGYLLTEMELRMKDMRFNTLYTIARLNSAGMCKTFINNGYHYSGLLINNTNISGCIESMTVFYKKIRND